MTDFKANVLRLPVESAAPATVSGSGKLYSKNVSSVAQEFYETDTGIEYQLTPVTPAIPITYAHSPAMITTGPRTLLNQAAAQNLFPSTRQTATLAASTLYQMRGIIAFGFAGTRTSTTLSLGFAGSGWTIDYVSEGYFTTVSTDVATGKLSVDVNTGSATAVTPVNDTRRFYYFYLDGTVTSTTGGTFTPQLTSSGAPGVAFVLDAASFLELTPLGADTYTTQGGWG